MKFSGLEIVGGIVIGIIAVALLLNLFWASPSAQAFCGDGVCSKDEIGSCKLDCKWCGDGYCEEGESCSSCSQDCNSCSAAAFCGDSVCNEGECSSGCSRDCPLTLCENGKCESQTGENCVTAPNDCKCQLDEKCDSSSQKCIKVACGNGVCDANENSINCPNDCKEKYTEVLSDPNKDFPIIFVHGHSPSEVEGYSPTTLEEFQNRLVEDGYTDEGYLLPSDYPPQLTKGVWAGNKVSVVMTYYANKYDKLGGVVGPDDNQHISVYAQRLRDVIEVLKHNTGKNKVIIIAHSMGGLVAREYIKDYGGSSSVDKLIMIGTPNHGTYGYIKELCGTIIAGRNPTPECDDMKSGSTFLINLNTGSETLAGIRYLTIIGLYENTSWCPNNEKWDGTICSSSVRLNGAENYEFVPQSGYSGSLHRDMVYPSKFPTIYQKIINFIRH